MPEPKLADKRTQAFRREWRKHHPLATRGEGPYIVTADGSTYLDAVGGSYVSLIGHGVPEIGEAMKHQLDQIAFPYGGAFTTEVELELAREALSRAPDAMAAAYFVSGGSEANEVAIKLARKYQLVRGRPSRWRIVSRWQSYHGATMATLSATGYTSRRKDFTPYMLDFPRVPAPYCYRCPLGLEKSSCELACAEALETTIAQEDADTIAAFICEPILGAAAGAVVPPDGYYERIRAICDEHDILLIADEVISAYGRTGSDFALADFGVDADITTCAKGISGGYAPLGAVLVGEKVLSALEESNESSIFAGYTYSAHPVSCAAGLAVLRYIEKNGLLERARTTGSWFGEHLRLRLGGHRSVGDIRGKGMLWGIEFVADRETKEPFPPAVKFGRRVVGHAFEEGVLLRAETGTVRGVAGDHILLAPPLTIDRVDLTKLVDVLERSITKAEQEARDS